MKFGRVGLRLAVNEPYIRVHIVELPFDSTCIEREIYFGVFSQKLRNTFCEPTYGRRDIGLHAKWLIQRVAVDFFNPLQQRFKGRANVGIQNLTFFRRHDMPPFLDEQSHAKRIFNKLHLMADRRMGEAKLVRCIADALMTGCRLETL